MTMTLLFDDVVPEAAPAVGPVRRAFGAVAAAFGAWRAARARRIALMSLMEMDAHRLDDLGISVQDVADALGKR